MLKGHKVFVWEKVLQVRVVTLAQQCEPAQCHRTVHLETVDLVGT